MKPYVLSKVPEEDVKLFEKIRQIVNDLPDIIFGKNEKEEELILSCHILARAIGKVFALKHIDGYFYPHYQHTWLLTPQGNIIDVYPVAILGGPILMDGSLFSPARWLYKKKRILHGETKKPSFRRALKIVEMLIRKML